MLTNGKYALVDNDSFDYLNQWNWNMAREGYARRSQYMGKSKEGKYKSDVLLMHRVIMNPPKGMIVDHINGDKLDNRRENMRNCSQADNLHNTRNLMRNNTSGYKGVSWDKTNQKWRAYIALNRKQKHLGYFDTKEEAAEAYFVAAKKLFGEYAYQNGF